jgi:hypothetical protein
MSRLWRLCLLQTHSVAAPLCTTMQARQVADVLTEKDVIRAHARDELGIGEA